jgi:hypothetical protein
MGRDELADDHNRLVQNWLRALVMAAIDLNARGDAIL